MGEVMRAADPRATLTYMIRAFSAGTAR
jgi:hypothetical protein